MWIEVDQSEAIANERGEINLEARILGHMLTTATPCYAKFDVCS
jgi:hypothetical protein